MYRMTPPRLPTPMGVRAVPPNPCLSISLQLTTLAESSTAVSVSRPVCQIRHLSPILPIFLPTNFLPPWPGQIRSRGIIRICCRHRAPIEGSILRNKPASRIHHSRIARHSSRRWEPFRRRRRHMTREIVIAPLHPPRKVAAEKRRVEEKR